MGLMMPCQVNPETTNHAAATNSPPAPDGPHGPGAAARSRRRWNQSRRRPGSPALPSSTGWRPARSGRNPIANTTALPRVTAPSAAIGPTASHGGGITTQATHPRAKRHRLERSSIRSNSPSILAPIDPLGGKQSVRPLQQPDRSVAALSLCPDVGARDPTSALPRHPAARWRGPTALCPAQAQAPARHRPFDPGHVERPHVLPPRRGQ